MIFAPNGGGGGINGWITSFIYGVNDVVFYNKSTYLCITGHTAAAAFETDFAAGKWQLLSQMLPNYISDYDGTNIGKWATYADAAGTSPVDGTGGSPTLTYAVSTDSSLRGTTNFLFTHGASNQQGQGFSYDFSIDPSDKGKVLQIYMEYLIASGTYASGDLTFWIYDVTNSTLIQPAPYSLQNSSIIEKFGLEFQTSSSSTSYRLIGHVTTTTATAYTIRFRNWNLGPQAKLYGSPITDWVSYTPALTNITLGNGTLTGRYRRVGDSAEIQITLVAGTTTSASAGTYGFGLPFTADSSKYPSADTIVGYATFLDTGVARYSGVVRLNSTTQAYISSLQSGSTIYSDANGTVSPSITTGDTFSLAMLVPILGWSSSVIMSSDAATNVVSSTAYRASSNLTVTAATPLELILNTLDTNGDTNGSFDTTTGRYTAKVSGYYRFSANGGFLMGATAASLIELYVKKNGTGSLYGYYLLDSLANSKNYTVPISDKVYLNAGDYISLWANSTGQNVTIRAGTDHVTSFSVERISGPAQIAASDTVAADAYLSNTTTITSGTKILNWSVNDNPNGAFDTTNSKFIAPISGKYLVSLNIMYNISAFTSTGQIDTSIYKNGSSIGYGRGPQFSSTCFINGTVTREIKLLSGDYLEFFATKAAGTFTASAHNDANASTVSIVRVGNY